MEFPNLGQHCMEKTCNRLDFLPMKCDACTQVFCSSHFNYQQHNCTSGVRRDYQVPLCPLCGEPVPTAPGIEPDLTVGQHIDKQCKSESRKIFTNRCSYKSCKRKELIPVSCSQCKQNFCLRHRHTTDHECQSTSAVKTSQVDQKRTIAAKAAEQRRTQKPPNTLFNSAPKPTTAAVRAAATQRLTAGSTQTENIQGNISEDEALARAIALSIIELDETNDRNRRNESAAVANTQRRNNNNNTTVPVGGPQSNVKDKCSLS